MPPRWRNRERIAWTIVCVVLLTGVGWARAGDDEATLRELLEQQRRQLETQRKQFQELSKKLKELEQEDSTSETTATDTPARPADPPKEREDSDKIKKTVADYLKDHPGAGMPPSVQTGFGWGTGFYIRSTPNPSYVKWEDESQIPFELQLHGRAQLDYYGYKVTDDANHETGAHQQTQNANSHRFADFSQFEVKRVDLVFAGHVFDPNLKFYVNLDGTTRGINGFQNNKVIQNSGSFDPNTQPISPLGGSVVADHTVRLRYANVSYDFHPCWSQKGCSPDCPEGTYRYSPTVTLIVGKMAPFYGLEQFLTTTEEQLVEFSMANWFFNADDNNKLTAAGTQIKALEDRFFLQAIVTNGNEAQFPSIQMDEYPGFVMGFWYDFGGTWDREKKRWELFGNSLSDIDWSCKPVVRVGASMNLVPMDRRSIYGDDEQSRVFVTPGAGPGGTRLINLLNGAGSTTATSLRGAHDVDKFDSYSYDVFMAGKWHGFSLSNEWWFRDLNNFHSAPTGFDQILYTYIDPRTNKSVTALFPNKVLFDYGMELQGGYFVIPRKLELVARWSFVSGDSGDILGNPGAGTQAIHIPSGVAAGALKGGLERVQINPGAFTHFHTADEYAIGFNYFLHGETLKWSTDLGFYRGGNPAGGGASAAGFIPGVDGWLFRTQFQIVF
jgi:hypothetical protein